jgi:hypothetical protein
MDDLLRMKASVMLATRERWESQVRQMKAAGVLEEELTVSYEDIKKFHDKGDYDIKLSDDYQIALEFGSHDSVLRTMVARRWQLFVSSPQSGGFVTSDHPVCLMRGGDSGSMLYPVGYGTGESIVAFPLSPELLVVGTFDGPSDVTQLSSIQVAYMNGIICHRAYRQIYSPDCDFRVLVGKNPKPMTAACTERVIA